MKQTKFGIGQLGNQTPGWANAVVGLIIVMTSVAVFIVASDPGIPDALKVRIGVYLKGLDMLVLGASKLFGIELQNPTWGKK